jgi:amino acid permease
MNLESKSAAPAGLARMVGVTGAVLLGLGSILGTGVFVGLGLAVWVEPAIWGAGLGLIAIGLVWHRVAGAVRRRAPRG